MTRNFKFNKCTTPMSLSNTRQGIIPHIVNPDTERMNAWQLPIENFIDLYSENDSLVDAVQSTLTDEHIDKGWDRSFHEYCNISADVLVVASTANLVRNRDPNRWVSGTSGLGFIANGGNRMQASTRMISCILAKCGPDVALFTDPSIRLYDLVHGSDYLVGPSTSQERKAHTRWIRLLGELINNCPVKEIWAFVGGSRADSIMHSALHIKELYDSSVSAYGITLPTPGLSNTDLKQWRLNLDSFILHTTSEKPRILLGVSDFQSVVYAIRNGIDVVDDSWIEEYSMNGKALFVSLETLLTPVKDPRITVIDKHTYVFDLSPEGKRGGEGLVHPVAIWKIDKTALQDSCGCWTCKKSHTRAYIHHLLCVNDMLAMVMLHHHNLYQFHKFISDIRFAMKEGRFEILAQAFSDVKF